MKTSYLNHEGYSDPTAGEAIEKATKKRKYEPRPLTYTLGEVMGPDVWAWYERKKKKAERNKRRRIRAKERKNALKTENVSSNEQNAV